MDTGTEFMIILLSVAISSLIDFACAVAYDSEEGGNTASKSVAIGLIFKVMIILFVVVPVLASMNGGKIK